MRTFNLHALPTYRLPATETIREVWVNDTERKINLHLNEPLNNITQFLLVDHQREIGLYVDCFLYAEDPSKYNQMIVDFLGSNIIVIPSSTTSEHDAKRLIISNEMIILERNGQPQIEFTKHDLEWVATWSDIWNS